MFKVTEVIDWPIDGDVESLELDSYVEEIRAFPFLTRLEVSRPVDTVHAPGDAHAMVIEGWFDDITAVETVPTLPNFAQMRAKGDAIAARASIRRYFSEVA